MMQIMYGNNEKRFTRAVDENKTPVEILAESNLTFAPSGIELNGVRLTTEEANTPLKNLDGATDGSILMYNKKNDNG